MEETLETTNSNSRQTSGLRQQLGFLAFFGLVISAYLTFHHVEVIGNFQIGPSLCNFGGGFNCDEVASSKYSQLFGVPISSLSFFYYFFFLILLVFERPTATMTSMGHGSGREEPWLLWSFLSLPPTLAYAGISLILLGNVCIFCCMLYLINLCLFGLAWNSKTASGGFAERCSGGVRYLLALFSRKGLYSALILLVSFFAFGVSLSLSWGFRELVFVPREAALFGDDALVPLYEQWKNGAFHQIPVSNSENPLERDFSVGSQNAELVIVEFSDFQCPYCKKAAKKLKPLASIQGANIRLVFKNYPLDADCNPVIEAGHHEYACLAARMARCAGFQGDASFWAMHDALFELGPLEWDEASLAELPKQLPIDGEGFSECLRRQEISDRLSKDISLGNNLKIPGTPTIFLNGKLLVFDNLEQIPGIIRLIQREQKRP